MRAPVVSVIGLGLLLGACAATTPAPPVPSGLAAGRILVVPRVIDVGNRAVAERAADLLAAALGRGAQVLGPQRLLAETSLGAGTWAGPALARMERGGWPTPEEAESMTRQLGIGALLAAGVSTYDQVWGKYAKFTRVSVDVDAFDLQAGTVIWRMRGRSEVEEMRGRAFDYAMEQAVGEVVEAIQPSHGISMIDLWRSWRR